MSNSLRAIGAFERKHPPQTYRNACVDIRTTGSREVKAEVSTALTEPQQSEAQLAAINRTLARLETVKKQLRTIGIPVDPMDEARLRDVHAEYQAAYAEVVAATSQRTPEGIAAAKAVGRLCRTVHILAERLIGPLAKLMHREAQRVEAAQKKAAGQMKKPKDTDEIVFDEPGPPKEGDTGDAAAADGVDLEFDTQNLEDPLDDVDLDDLFKPADGEKDGSAA